MTTSPVPPASGRGKRVTAVLGPTNTGKTHLAVERMLGHETGMIGLPLRLLAREVFDRIVERRGADCVALITGEEKIVPAEPRYYVCTVEAMPFDRTVDFLAIDEIQLAADPDRGHIFTERLLTSRGRTETMVLGADTIRPLIERLLPGTNFIARPRFSRLTYAGQKKITRLPRRSAIVTFSADSVYAIAELIRRQRGGAAVVLGALSPRTRNAQVALYQSGDVDFLVATDAVGMGLNMDVNHVAFAATRKFDGSQFRELSPAELAQVAGRAGRHMNDGTFGVTADAAPFDAEIVDRIENHRFDPLKVLQWRNRELDMSSLDALRASLNASPPFDCLVRARTADDVHALEVLCADDDVRRLAASPDAVARLWDVCQVPDYRNITGGDHAAMVGRLYQFLMTGKGVIAPDWFARQLSYADRTDGDIDTLANRIAHVRTWTFVANRADWLEHPGEWRDRTRAIEDRLSDALHERLAQRFVDRRTSVLMKRMREKEDLMAAVSGHGEILVEGEHIGHLTGFHFVPDGEADGVHGKALRAASLKIIAGELADRATALAQAGDGAFALDNQGALSWNGEKVARLKAGDTVLRPRVGLIADDLLNGPLRQGVQDRLEAWLAAHVSTLLEPLVALSAAEDVTGLARGVAFRLVENLGVLIRDDVAEDVRQLDQDARGRLRRHGVRFGAFHVFVPALLKPAPARLRLLLWALQREAQGDFKLQDLPAPPPDGLTSVPFDRATPRGFYNAVGYRVCGGRAVRIDMLERLGDVIRTRLSWKPAREGDERPAGSVPGGFTVVPDMMSLVGCSGEDFAGILRALGFRVDRRRVETPAAVEAPRAAGTDPAPVGEAPVAPEPAEPAEPAAPDVAGPATADDPVAVAADAAEPQFLEVWRPRRPHERGRKEGHERPAGDKPRRARADTEARPRTRSRGKPKDGRPKDAGPKDGGSKDGRARTAPRHAPRKDAPPTAAEIASSPFAALMDLKKALEKGAGGGD